VISPTPLTAHLAEARTAAPRPPAAPRRRRRGPAAFVAALCALAAGVSACGDAQPPADPGAQPPAQEVVEAPTAPAEVEVPTEPGIAQETVDIIDALEYYWTAMLPAIAGVDYVPLSGVYPYDPNDLASAPVCGGAPLAPPDNAYYCPSGNFIAFDRGLAEESYGMGDAAFAAVLAHEVGHQIEDQLEIPDDTTWVSEMRTDCLAGAWMGWMDSQKLMEPGDTAEIARQLAAIADPRPDRKQLPDGHGSREERMAAFAEGFNSGPQTCLGAV